MANEEKVVLELSLDDKQFIDSLLKAKTQLKGLGDPKNTAGLKDGLKDASLSLKEIAAAGGGGSLKSLTSGLMGMAVAAGVTAVAVYGIKAAFEAALAGDELRKLDNQFELLSRNAGIAAGKMKSDFMKAADGLLSTSEATKLASDAIVKLGSNAQKIPEVMELARKTTEAMGGSLEQNFTRITNAIAKGETRSLAQLGLFVDSKKAVENYAKELGVAASALSEAGKQQAIMNALLEKGEKSLKGIGEGETLEDSWKKLSAALRDTVEWFQKLISQSKIFKTVIDGARSGLERFNDIMKSTFGTESQKAEGRIIALNGEIQLLQKELDKMGNVEGLGGAVEKRADLFKKKIESLKQQQAELQGIIEKAKADDAAQAPGKTDDSAGAVDLEKKLALERKFNEEILKMRDARIQAEIGFAQTEQELLNAQNEQKLIAAQNLQLALDQIKMNTDLTAEQKRQAIEEAELNHQMKLRQMQEDTEKQYEQMMNNRLKHSTSVMNGIANAAAKSSAEQKKALTDSGKAGALAYENLSNLGVAAFDALGRGAVDGSNQIGKVMLKMIGDIAGNYGKMMLLASVWPPNPVGLVAGAALIALGGFLGGKASSMGGSASPEAIQVPEIKEGGGGSSSSFSSTSDRPLMDEVPEKKQVTIAIQGNYFDTDQTRQRLMEMIRESTDATDFAYKQIGQQNGSQV